MSKLIEEKLVEILSSDTLLAISVAGRVYPVRLPDSVSMSADSVDLPALSYILIASTAKMEVDYVFSTFQVSVFGRSYAEAKEVAEQVKKALHRYKGGQVEGTAVVGSRDMSDPTTGLAYIPVDVRFAHTTQ